MSTDYQALAAQLLAKARKQQTAQAIIKDLDSSNEISNDSFGVTIPSEFAESLVEQSTEPKIELENHGNKIIVGLDSMQLGFIQACLRKYDLRHNKLIDAREHSQGINKGILMHEFLRFYYVARRNQATIKQSTEEAITHGRKKIPELSLDDDAVTDTTRKFLEYGQKYNGETIEIVDIEQPFSVDLFEDDQLVIVWEGIRDLDYNLQFEKYVMDHKTASRKGNWDPMHNQLVGYAYARGCKNIMINEIVFVKTPGDGFHRHPLSVSREILNLFRESTIAAVKNYLAYAAADYYPPNMHSCNQQFGCTFKEFCAADDRTREWLMKTKYHYTTKWDPFTRG
jgi:hypothetical protein